MEIGNGGEHVGSRVASIAIHGMAEAGENRHIAVERNAWRVSTTQKG